jgi:uncharacterized membrane protein YdjX (TVP38/TMEM64 family)
VNRRKLVVRLIVVAALIAAIVFAAFHRDFWQKDVLERELTGFGPWAPVLFIGAYAAATVLFVPGVVFTLTGGALFGPFWGTIWNLVGATIGATLAFLTARYVAADWVGRTSGDRLKRVVRGVEAEGWRFVAFVRLVPLFPFNLLNYVLGLTRIGLSTYVVTSAVCMIPGVAAYTWLGYTGRQALSGGHNLIRDVLIAIAVLAAAALLPRLVQRVRKEQAAVGGDSLTGAPEA